MGGLVSVVQLLPDDLQDRDVFAQRLVEIYGETRALRLVEQANTSRSKVCYWLNPLRAREETGEPLSPEDHALAGMPGVWVSLDRERVTHSEAAQTGEIYIQNPSSLLAVRALAPQPEEEVLDLAAAPGGKTIALAIAMQNSGRLAAVEPVVKRFHRLKANVARCGVENVEFYQRDGRGVGRAVGERFDRVLLDAPCSSESRMRWDNPGSYQHWQARKVKEVQRKQKSLLRSAYAALKPGGVLIYCTCSLNLEENELVVAHLLRKTSAQISSLEALDHIEGLESGRIVSGRKALPAELELTRRVYPHDVWDGFYLAKIKKPS